MPTDRGERSAQTSHVPKLDCVVAAAGNHRARIIGNRQSGGRALEFTGCPPASLGLFYVPDANGSVPAAAHKPRSTGRKGDSNDRIGMSAIRVENFSRIDFEKLNITIVAPDGGEPTVRGKVHASDLS